MSRSSVVMADIAGFTAFAGRARPEEILALLTEVFATFDRLAAELGVEKIKTIGDAYMAVAGAPLEQADHAERAVALAIAMQREAPAMPSLAASGLGMRVGVASGAVTAGVIGTQKPAYDVWGDTVNLASRMETTGVIGQIQLAASTAKLVSASYRLIRRESVSIKGKGEMTTYLLDPATA